MEAVRPLDFTLRVQCWKATILHLIYILCLMLTKRWACEGGRPDWKVFVYLQVENHHQRVSFAKYPSPTERMEVARWSGRTTSRTLGEREAAILAGQQICHMLLFWAPSFFEGSQCLSKLIFFLQLVFGMWPLSTSVTEKSSFWSTQTSLWTCVTRMYDMYVLQPRRRDLLTWWACSITLSGLPRHQSKVCNSSSSNWLGSVDIILFLGKEQTLTLRETQGEREFLQRAKGRHNLQLPLPERSVLHGWYLSSFFNWAIARLPFDRSSLTMTAMCAVSKAKKLLSHVRAWAYPDILAVIKHCIRCILQKLRVLETHQGHIHTTIKRNYPRNAKTNAWKLFLDAKDQSQG